MEPRDVIKIATIEEFNELLDSMNLSSRQRKIFKLKYSYLMRIVDIAALLDIHQDTVSDDLKVIREKLKQISQNDGGPLL